ncbi:MAG: hypothetical protein ACK4PI_01415 [Tepidisphaerales bacterium]
MSRRGLLGAGLALVAVAGVAVAVGMLLREARPDADGPSREVATRVMHASPAATAPSAPDASRDLAEHAVIRSFDDYLNVVAPDVARAERSATPLPLEAAATVQIASSAYLDSRGDLWLTHPRGLSVAERVSSPLPWTAGTHIVSTVVRFVHWQRDDRGRWWAEVVHGPTDGELVWQTARGATRLARRDYRWACALRDREGRWLVPTSQGVAVLERAGDSAGESHHDLPDGRTDVVLVPTPTAVYAFRPWDNGRRGSTNVHRWNPVAGTWSVWSAEDGGPQRVVHLFLLGDGAILSLSAGDDAGLDVSTILEPATRDAERDARIRALVGQLGNPSADVRRAARDELSRMGPSAWPVLEAELGRHAPPTDQTVRRLLARRLRPTVGLFELFPGPVTVLARGADGSLALACYGGVRWFEEAEDSFRSPAVLVVRPNLRAELMPERFLERRAIEDLRLTLLPGEVLHTDPEQGLLRWMGNHFAPLLPPPRWTGYRVWLGTDREKRWLFATAEGDRFLLLDPGRLDPTPRLPAWPIRIDGGRTGWDDAGHAVIERGGHAWRLEARGWAPLTPPGRLRTHDDDPAAAWLAGWPQGGDARPVIGVVRVGENRVLVLKPGVVVRMSRPKADGPWTEDARFTEQIPERAVRRFWADPFGRACIAHGEGELTVLFPGGFVPPELAVLMTRPSGGAGPHR